jgi:hypothetical protein
VWRAVVGRGVESCCREVCGELWCGELLQGGVWRAVVGRGVESCCREGCGELLQGEVWRELMREL